MNSATLILRSLRYHARAHLGALLGAVVGSAVLVGALVVGDSVRGSLRDMALARLGSTDTALSGGDRFFRARLANDLGVALSGSSSHTLSNAKVQSPLSSTVHATVAPLIQVQGTASAEDGRARANRVQVLGVDDAFWKLGLESAPFASTGADEVILNAPLATQLRARTGDRILLRIAKPSLFSRDAPLSPQEDFAVAVRVSVKAIATDRQMGRFGLQASQVPPLNAFVSLSWLGRQLQQLDRANLLLCAGAPDAGITAADTALHTSWELSDAELDVMELAGNGGLELRTRRVFLDPAIAAATLRATPKATGVLTYFVNELRVGNRATPYSMVTAMDGSPIPTGMREDEILINSWLAEDLHAGPGDSLSLRYFVVGGSRRLEEHTHQFVVRAVIPMTGAAADRTLMPEFPGLEKAESTRDWDSSLPIQLDRIRPKDEAYWKQYRGTPKAFVTLAAGQKMWANRFGDLTAVRYAPGTSASDVSRIILRSLTPASIGLSFQPVREQARAASDQAQDFGQLFLGFSFFLIVAALLLMALLFQFGIETRAVEVGTLLATGFTPRQVRRLLLWEGAVLALVGAVLGLPAGIGYSRGMLYSLSTIWHSAVGTSDLTYHATPASLAIGAVSGLVIGCVTLALALRRQAQQPARALLTQGAEASGDAVSSRRSRGIWVGWMTSAFAMLMIGTAGVKQEASSPEVFFLAGALLLISGGGFAAAFLAALGSSDTAQRPSLTSMGVRNATRRRRRSLATVGLLACGCFLIAAIGAFRLESSDSLRQRSSGTGGFALLGEATLPIVQDLNTEQGRDFFGLAARDLEGVHFVPVRVREGDDASCLNLNRAQSPRLLGVRPEFLSERRAFTFTQVAAGLPADSPWLLLNREERDGTVPAIGDATSIQWALGKTVGDTFPYTDEHGRQFRLRLVAALANSVLQGSLIISETHFLNRFPSESGYRLFLIDVDRYQRDRINAVAASLSRATQDYGMELIPAADRLAAFNAVQNTYLSTFQVLGGLGLLLGSAGLGVLVLRNVLERRSELALLTAVGFRIRALRWLVLSEHAALLVLGLLIGGVAAAVAVLPTVLSPGVRIPFRSLGWTVLAVLASGAAWTWVATRLALRGRLLDALRNE
jgi:ABC-type lipoprotein release transport system permease subunit